VAYYDATSLYPSSGTSREAARVSRAGPPAEREAGLPGQAGLLLLLLLLPAAARRLAGRSPPFRRELAQKGIVEFFQSCLTCPWDPARGFGF